VADVLTVGDTPDRSGAADVRTAGDTLDKGKDAEIADGARDKADGPSDKADGPSDKADGPSDKADGAREAKGVDTDNLQQGDQSGPDTRDGGAQR